MAKSKRTIKQTQLRNAGGIGQQLEHSEVFDDNLLPDASEIEKLQRIDPTMIDWLKERATKEQEFRHKAYNDRIDIISKAERNLNLRNTLGVIFAFFIVCGGLGLSYSLLQSDHLVTGTIFGGATIFSGAALFLSNTKKKEEPTNEEQS